MKGVKDAPYPLAPGIQIQPCSWQHTSTTPQQEEKACLVHPLSHPSHNPSEVSSCFIFPLTGFWNSYKWNHTLCIPLRLASFTLHYAYRIHHVFECSNGLFHFHWVIAVHGTKVLQFIHSAIERHLGCYQCVAIIYSAAMNTCKCLLIYAYEFLIK